MKILAHRGYWKSTSEHNQYEAFSRAFEQGWGIETDLRDHNRQIIISHDMPNGSEMTLAELLELMQGRNLPLALNIKADGLASSIQDLLKRYQQTEYFVFDMSLPELVVYLRCGLRTFTGLSDLMPVAPLLSQADGVWLDCFKGDWYGASFIDSLFEMTPTIALVSPDLHRRPYKAYWTMIQQCKEIANPSLLLCTDHPDEAQKFFGNCIC